MSDKALPGAGGVLRLRNLAMLESIRPVADPAWRDRLERQQTLARPCHPSVLARLERADDRIGRLWLGRGGSG
jgi:hypothetical protein